MLVALVEEETIVRSKGRVWISDRVFRLLVLVARVDKEGDVVGSSNGGEHKFITPGTFLLHVTEVVVAVLHESQKFRMLREVVDSLASDCHMPVLCAIEVETDSSEHTVAITNNHLGDSGGKLGRESEAAVDGDRRLPEMRSSWLCSNSKGD